MSPALPQLPDTEQLFEEMPCGLLVTSVDGTILRVNDTFCRWVHLSAEDLVGKKKLQELFTMGARIFHQTHWLPMLQMQGSISEVKFDVKGKDGNSLPMLLNVIRRTTPSAIYDEISAFIAEDRNKYERELLAARKRADSMVLLEKDRVLFAEQMIGIVSHDLRNPLSVVMLSTKMLATRGDKLSDEMSQRMLSNIARAGERAQRLIEDLLDFTVARLGRGLTVSLEPTDLHQVAEKAVDELSLAHPGRTLRLVRQGNADVMADPHRLSQLLGNLISNALSYGDPVGLVTVTTGVVVDRAVLTVHNTGPVIPPATLATMFDPMVRGVGPDNATRSVGLGLFIVRAIAAAHHGEIAATSSAEAGTQFHLTFPIAPNTASDRPAER
jgi:sigma-B regulation protein RsbU (phosphoserine phosphatase)